MILSKRWTGEDGIIGIRIQIYLSGLSTLGPHLQHRLWLFVVAFAEHHVFGLATAIFINWKPSDITCARQLSLYCESKQLTRWGEWCWFFNAAANPGRQRRSIRWNLQAKITWCNLNIQRSPTFQIEQAWQHLWKCKLFPNPDLDFKPWQFPVVPTSDSPKKARSTE